MGTNEGSWLNKAFTALADPLSRDVLEVMYAEPGIAVSGLCNAFHVSRFTIMRQINALEDENIIRRERIGKTKRLFIESRAFSLLANGWLRLMSLSEYESTSLKED